MSAPPSLPSSFFQHLHSRPEDPWLFHQEGWDWRWFSWRAIGDRVALWAGPLAGLGVPPGSRVAFAGGAHPAAVCLDRAIQGAGLVSVPLALRPGEKPGEKLLSLGCRAWAEPEGSFSPAGLPPGIERLVLPAWVPAGRSLEAQSPPTAPDSQDVVSAGGVVLEREGVPLELSAEDLAAWAVRIGERIGPSEDIEREILILDGSLAGWAERGMLSWATAAGAVVLLEGDPESRTADAAWARVTLFHGTARELGELRKTVEEDRRGRWLDRLLGRTRLPFGRLRTVVAAGSEPLEPEELAFWEGRGVKVVELPPRQGFQPLAGAPPWYINGERGERDA